jgi:hypothetical protein
MKTGQSIQDKSSQTGRLWDKGVILSTFKEVLEDLSPEKAIPASPEASMKNKNIDEAHRKMEARYAEQAKREEDQLRIEHACQLAAARTKKAAKTRLQKEKSQQVKS